MIYNHEGEYVIEYSQITTVVTMKQALWSVALG